MVIVQCNQCGKQYDVPDEWAGRSAKCKSCGNQLSIPRPTPPPLPPPVVVTPASQTRRGLLIGVCLVGGAIMAAMIVADHQPRSLEDRVIAAASQFAIDGVKAPSTAKIIGKPRASQHPGDPSRWGVVGKIDAQNAFGTMLRQPWCVDLVMTTHDKNPGKPAEVVQLGSPAYGNDMLPRLEAGIKSRQQAIIKMQQQAATPKKQK